MILSCSLFLCNRLQTCLLLDKTHFSMLNKEINEAPVDLALSKNSLISTAILPYADLNVAAAMLALFSLFLMAMGAICITMSLSKEILFFLKPASVFFILSG